MATRRPWRSVVACGVGVLLLAWGALAWWLPAWLEGQIAGALREQGVTPVALEVGAPGLRGMRIRELTIGSAPDLRVGEVALRWSLGSLLRARAEALRIRDVEWRFALDEDRIDLGALAPLLESGPAEPREDVAPTVIPIDALHVEDVRLTVDTPDGVVTGDAALAVAIAEQGVDSGSFTLDASDEAGALSVHAEASLGEAGRLEAEVTARLREANTPLLGMKQGSFTLHVSGTAPGAAHVLATPEAIASGLSLAGRLETEATGPALEAEARGELRVDERTATLQLTPLSLALPDQQLTVAGARLDAAVSDWTKPLPRVERLALAIPDARFGDVAVNALALELDANAGSEGVGGSASLSGDVRSGATPDASIRLRGTYVASDDTFRLELPDCATVELAAGALAPGWTLSQPLSLCLEATHLAVRVASDGAREVEGAARLAGTSLRLESADGERIAATTPRLALELQSGDRGERLHVAGAGGEVRFEALEVAIAGLASELELRRTPDGEPEGELSLRVDALRDDAAEMRFRPLAISGDATWVAQQLRFRAEARDGSGGFRLEAVGHHALDAGGGQADVTLPAVRFAEAGLQPAGPFPVLAGFVTRADGELSGSARVAWTASGLEPVRVDVAAQALSAETPWLNVRGLDTALRLDDALALTTGPRQQLSLEGIDPGLPFEDVTAGFTLEASRLRVHELEASVAGGRLRASGEFDPEALAGSLVLNLDAVDLVRLLEEEPVEGLEGSGRLHGEIDVAVDPGGMPRHLKGRLQSEAPGGVIRYRPASPPAELAAAGAGGQQTLEILRNLAYRELAIVLDGDAEAVRVRFDLAGSNPDYQAGVPIEFQLNVASNYGRLLRALRLTERFEAQRRQATGPKRPTMVPAP
ncbi:MAG: YdbH domain-containing protein [Myxococcota bacterium]